MTRRPLLALTLSTVAALATGACSGGSGSEHSGTESDGGTASGATGSSGGSGGGSSGSESSSTGGTSGGSSGSSSGATSSGASPSSSSSSSSSGSTSGASSGSSSGAGSSSGSSGSGDAGCTDKCPAPNAGIAFGCEKRFLFGVNYAWQNWGADFGGGGSGVAGNSTQIKAALTDMHSHGVDVVRWWMFQEFNGNAGPALDSNGIPTGKAAGTTVADIQAALSIAAEVGVHYNFTLFSFDNFTVNGTNHDLGKVITNAGNLANLETFVALVAKTVQSDPNADRVVSWDVINEPEWAIGGADGDVTQTDNTGQDPYGDPTFNGGSSGKTVDLVTFSQMEAFVKATVTTLHDNGSALVTVGSAAIKWQDAWQHVGLDYTTVHMYDWINQWYPYNTPVSTFGFSTPLVMGEFPSEGLSAVSAGTGKWPSGSPAVPYDTLLPQIFGKSIGYAGAMSWAYNDSSSASFSWSTYKTNIASFQSTESCVTQY